MGAKDEASGFGFVGDLPSRFSNRCGCLNGLILGKSMVLILVGNLGV